MESIKEKAQRYDDAIKVAKSKIKNDKDHVLYEEDITDIFPELKEPEDERVKKEIISAINIYCSKYHRGTKVRNDMLAWLEKQNSNVDNANKEYWRGYREGKQEILDKYAELVKQNPAWSEEDKKFINEIEESLLAYKIIVMDNDRELANYIEKEINWLKSLKGRVQPKQEWGEGDERYFNIVSSVIGSPSVQGIYDYHKVNPTDVSDWLREHIQPQKQWKPSEEQMKALNSVILKGELSYVNQGKELISLYNYLKRF